MNTQQLRSELSELRRDIDGADVTIVLLLVQRQALARQVIQLKTRAGLPVVDPSRETQIHRTYEDAVEGGAAIARAILESSRGDHHES